MTANETAGVTLLSVHSVHMQMAPSQVQNLGGSNTTANVKMIVSSAIQSRSPNLNGAHSAKMGQTGAGDCHVRSDNFFSGIPGALQVDQMGHSLPTNWLCVS